MDLYLSLEDLYNCFEGSSIKIAEAENSCRISMFSAVEVITLEQYIIRQKIEQAKELLFYDELNPSEIANTLGYSSVAHLSASLRKLQDLVPQS